MGFRYFESFRLGFGLKFRVGSRVRRRTHKVCQRTNRTKRGENNYKDEDNSPNIPSEKNNQPSFQKFRQLLFGSVEGTWTPEYNFFFLQITMLLFSWSPGAVEYTDCTSAEG